MKVGARLRILLAVLLGSGLVVAGYSVEPGAADSDVRIEHFMTGLACIESSGRYSAVNSKSGALGKYQIMPRNWRTWSGKYLGDSRAKPTPENQEIVAFERISRLYKARGTWRRVAYWWLSGRSINDESRWSAKGRRYADRVMAIAERAANPRTASKVPARCFPRLPASLLAAGSSADAVRVSARAVFVRRAPGTSNRVTAIVRRGDVLAVLDSTKLSNGRTWLRVELPSGRKGWVSARLTQPVRGN